MVCVCMYVCECVCALHSGWHAINNALTWGQRQTNRWIDTTEMIDLVEGEKVKCKRRVRDYDKFPLLYANVFRLQFSRNQLV